MINQLHNHEASAFGRLLHGNTEKQSGFFDLPKVQRCTHPEHEPPQFLYIPQGKGYKHTCPCCGKTATLIPQQISF